MRLTITQFVSLLSISNEWKGAVVMITYAFFSHGGLDGHDDPASPPWQKKTVFPKKDNLKGVATLCCHHRVVFHIAFQSGGKF